MFTDAWPFFFFNKNVEILADLEKSPFYSPYWNIFSHRDHQWNVKSLEIERKQIMSKIQSVGSHITQCEWGKGAIPKSFVLSIYLERSKLTLLITRQPVRYLQVWCSVSYATSLVRWDSSTGIVWPTSHQDFYLKFQ